MPKAVDQDEQRARIVEATWRVIVEEGLDKATMRRIASRAGCTTGLVTHYFTSKEDVLLSVVRTISRRARDRHASAREGLTGIAALRSVLLTGLPTDPEHMDEWKIWFALWNQSITSPVLQQQWTRRAEGWSGLVRSALVEAIECGEVDANIDVDATVEALAAMNYGLAVTAVLSPSRVEPEAIVEVVDHQLRLLTPTAGKSSKRRRGRRTADVDSVAV